MILKHNKVFLVVIAASFISAVSAQINLKANTINFRDYNNPGNTTTHYGDLILSGGQSGTSWGWLTANRINSVGDATFGSTAWCLGDMITYGNLSVYGAKNFLHPHPTDSTKIIKYIAIESGEALTVARGTAKTVNGASEIVLPEHFTLVTSTKAPVTVIVTPEKVPALLYVKEKSTEKIVIGMKSADHFEFGDIEFAYQVTGVRDGFEDEQIIVEEENLSGEKSLNLSNNNNEVKARIAKRAEKARSAIMQKAKKKESLK